MTPELLVHAGSVVWAVLVAFLLGIAVGCVAMVMALTESALPRRARFFVPRKHCSKSQ